MPTQSQPRPGTRDALLEAAEELFAGRGYASVGVREIVERAGANIAAVNYHFGSKSALYLETVRRSMARGNGDAAWQQLTPAPPDRSQAAAALARFIHRFLEHIIQTSSDACACSLLIREAVEPSEAVDAVVRDFIQPHQRALLEVIERLNPDLSQGDRVLHAEGVIGQILHYRVFRPFVERLGVCELSNPAAVARVARHISMSCLRAMGCDEMEIAQALRGTGAEVRGVNHHD
jgi:AcrR family transcriptional regulator